MYGGALAVGGNIPRIAMRRSQHGADIAVAGLWTGARRLAAAARMPG